MRVWIVYDAWESEILGVCLSEHKAEEVLAWYKKHQIGDFHKEDHAVEDYEH